MSERRLVLGQGLLQRILEHCLEEKPYEACGILGGQGGRIHHAFSIANIRRSPVLFEMEAGQQALVLQRLKELGQEVVGIYHSHPTATPWPSALDVEQAVHYPEAVRMILSLNGPTRIGAFLIRQGRVEPLSVAILSGLAGEFHDLRLWGQRGREA